MSQKFLQHIKAQLLQFKRDGVYKQLQYIKSPQGPEVEMEDWGKVIVLSSNNYLGLANHPELVKSVKAAVDDYGTGLASVRFICGTLDLHRKLEEKTASFLGFEAATTYTSCWNANEAVFPTLFDENDLIVSDALNHASIIDGVRLAKKANKKVYPHADMKALEEILQAGQEYRSRAVVTDGVFSMEGDVAPLPQLHDLCKKYDALLIVDDSHATGVLGAKGRGSFEHFSMPSSCIDILTGTYGKALGGAAGGFICANQDLIDYFVQRSRPQLFSNALPPSVAAGALAAINELEQNPELVSQLSENTLYFREKIEERGFQPLSGPTPIIPIIVKDTALAIEMSKQLLHKGVFVTGFGFPVVPQNEARLRVQISAAHTQSVLNQAIDAITEVGQELKFITG